MIERIQYKTASTLIRLGNAVTYYRNIKLKSLGLTSVQGDALRLILRSPGVTAPRLKQQLGLSQSTVAGILARLESKKLIRKDTDEGDARKVPLYPTEEGLLLDNNLKETALKTQSYLTSGMTALEQAEFDRLLDIALNNMNAMRTGKE